MRISDWSSDVCSSDLRYDQQPCAWRNISHGGQLYGHGGEPARRAFRPGLGRRRFRQHPAHSTQSPAPRQRGGTGDGAMSQISLPLDWTGREKGETFLLSESNSLAVRHLDHWGIWPVRTTILTGPPRRSEEHTSELQSLMRISYAVFCLKKKNKQSHSRPQASTFASYHIPSYSNYNLYAVDKLRDN